MKKLSCLPAPALAGVIREKTAAAAIAEIKNCMYDGADMIDLHLSCLENTDKETLQKIISSTPLPLLALHYNRTFDWGNTDFDEEERVACLLCAVEAGAAGLDMQGYTFHAPSKAGFCGEDKYSFTKGGPKEVVTDPAIIAKQCSLIEQVHGMGAEVLLSCHPGIPMSCTQVVDLALFLEQRGADIIKIVTVAKNEEHLSESIRAMLALKKEVKTPVSYHTTGDAGTLSRIINPILGGQIAFCVDGFTESSTMGQLDLKATKTVIDHIKRMG